MCSKYKTKIPNHVISYRCLLNFVADSKFTVRKAFLNFILYVKFNMRLGSMFQVNTTRLQKCFFVISSLKEVVLSLHP